MMNFIQKHNIQITIAIFSLIFCACVSGSRARSHGDDVCGICGKDLGWVNIVSEGKQYHPDCFDNHSELQCSVCKKPIFDKYAKDNDSIYHITCFKETKLKRCSVCNLPMEGEYITDLWGQATHKNHKDQPAGICDSCGRIICPASLNGVKYQDGRLTCGICKTTAVMDEKTVRPVMVELTKLFEKKGIGPFSLKRIHVSLVDSKTLDSEYKTGNMRNKRGETQTAIITRNGETLNWSHQIRVQYGLHLTVFKGILAHEMLHVWLNENKVKMSNKEIEGFCNLGIMLVNENENSDISKVLQQNLEQNPDEVYGDGYRLMKTRLGKLGWPKLISQVKKR